MFTRDLYGSAGYFTVGICRIVILTFTRWFYNSFIPLLVALTPNMSKGMEYATQSKVFSKVPALVPNKLCLLRMNINGSLRTNTT